LTFKYKYMTPLSLAFDVSKKRLVRSDNHSVSVRALQFIEGEVYTITVDALGVDNPVLTNIDVELGSEDNAIALSKSTTGTGIYYLSVNGDLVRQYLYKKESAPIIFNLTVEVSGGTYSVQLESTLQANPSANTGNIGAADPALTAVIQSKQDKVAGKGLSTEDFTSEDKVKLSSIDMGSKVDKVVGKELSSNDFSDIEKAKLDGIDMSSKVDKVEGKGLSSEDYTLQEKTKLAGIDMASKVDKVQGKGLSTEDYTTEEKAKLAGIDMSTKVDKATGKQLSSNDYTDLEKAKLANLDNTKDSEKAISDATAEALSHKADLVDGKVPLTQLPALGSGNGNASIQTGTQASLAAANALLLAGAMVYETDKSRLKIGDGTHNYNNTLYPAAYCYTSVTGASDSLDQYATTQLEAGTTVFARFSPTSTIGIWTLKAGASATVSGTIQRPADFSTGTNEKYWEAVAIGVSDGGNTGSTTVHPIQQTPSNVYTVDVAATGTGDGSSWENAFTDIQVALDAAAASIGKRLWVKKGTYYPNSNNGWNTSDPRCRHYKLYNNILLYGGFEGWEGALTDRTAWTTNKTILSNARDNNYHIMRNAQTSSYLSKDLVMMDGFYFQGI
jgi:hypothetical protein